MGKPTICIGENKDADQHVFATRILHFLLYLNPKFQASSSFLCLYSPVCVGPVRKPHCWFSHEAAHMVPIKKSLNDHDEAHQRIVLSGINGIMHLWKSILVFTQSIWIFCCQRLLI